MKKSYEKPELEKVKLGMTENVLCACKGSGICGPDTHNCVAYTGGACNNIYGNDDAS